MVSAVTDEQRSFGFSMTNSELERVNIWRRRRDPAKELLTQSPGLITLEIGANREGYWTSVQFSKQMADLQD